MAELGRSARVFLGLILVLIGIILIPVMLSVMTTGGMGGAVIELLVLPLFPMIVGIILVVSGLKGGGE